MTARQIIEERIKDRHCQKGQQQTERLATDHQHADRSISTGARSTGQDERSHTGNQSNRRHQDRPQPIAVSLNNRVVTFHSLLTQSVRVIDLQNRVLLHHPKQQQQAQAGKDVHRLPGDQQRDNAERNRQRQRQQNRPLGR